MCSEKNLIQSQSAHYIFYVNFPRKESGPLWREAGNSPPELWHRQFLAQRRCLTTLQLTFQNIINVL